MRPNFQVKFIIPRCIFGTENQLEEDFYKVNNESLLSCNNTAIPEMGKAC